MSCIEDGGCCLVDPTTTELGSYNEGMRRPNQLLRHLLAALVVLFATTVSLLLRDSAPDGELPPVADPDAEVEEIFREAERAGLVIRVEALRP